VRTNRAGQSPLLLLDVVEILRRENIDYAVVGALALSVHGHVRASLDADALLFTAPGQLKKLRTQFEQAGFGTELRYGDIDDPIPAMLVLTDAHTNQVELLGGLRGIDPQLLARTVEVTFAGEQLRFVGREDFIAMKCFTGSSQDILDAQSAFQNAEVPLDLDLLRRLTRRFGRDAADKLEQLLAH
jgi:predicted nucleotidyltransferase